MAPACSASIRPSRPSGGLEAICVQCKQDIERLVDHLVIHLRVGVDSIDAGPGETMADQIGSEYSGHLGRR